MNILKLRSTFVLFTLILCIGCENCKDKENNPTPEPEVVYEIGDYHLGGIIFHLNADKKSGLIAAEYDQSSSSPWGCEGIDIADAENNVVGAGKSNTNAIKNICVGSGTLNIAARAMEPLGPDWYLPSIDELELLYNQKIMVGNFKDATYWSSSQSDANSGFRKNFTTGNKGGHLKDIQNSVRAIRSF